MQISPLNIKLNNISPTFKARHNNLNNVTNIVQLNSDVFVKNIENIFPSNTMKLLYSPEFNTPQKLNNDGYWETTIIDRKTNKPVKAYVKEDIDAKKMSPDYEQWNLYVKNKDTGEYELAGARAFEINEKKNQIDPFYIESYKDKEYKGIGARCHQIAIERMLQKDFDNVEIYSVESAKGFHKKCGFESVDNTNIMRFSDRNLDTWKKLIKSQPIMISV